MALPVIAHPDVINFLKTYSESELEKPLWKSINKLRQQQFDNGLRVKKLKGIAKRVWEARVTRAVRLIFTYNQSLQPDTGERQIYIAIQDLCLDHDDVSRRSKARQRTPDNQWLDAEELETVGSLETERTSLTPNEQSAIEQAEAEELQISEEIVDELVGNIQWRVVESESEWQQAITHQDVDLPLKLTPEEYELVNHYGNLLLSGNAGTGKTTVALYRLLKSLETLPAGKRLYIAYNPILVKAARQQLNRLVGTKISEVESLFEFKTIRDLCLEILESAGETYLESDEINYQRFNQLYRRSERQKYPPALVWDEIRSIIKGSCLQTDKNLLSRNQYKNLGRKRSSTISTDQRPKIYELAEWYQRQLDTEGRFDEIDLARQVLKLIQQGIGNRYEMIICDEVQDLTELQLHLLLQLVTPNGHLFFAGDLNQIVSPSGFRWRDLKSELYRNNRPVKEETLHFNFRSVGSLDQLANQLLKLKSRLLNERADESSQAISSYGEWARLINAPLSKLKPTLEQLYPQDAILVRTEAEKEQLSDEFQSSFVFTIEEAKGLEFDTVFLVEFFQLCSSLWQKVLEGKGTLKDKEKPELRRELNLLYVAITRTRRILNIWETQLSSLWTQEEVDSFTQEIESESVRKVRVEPTAEMWKERGLYYLEAKFYRQAIECFKFSGDFQLQRQSEAKLLLQEGKESEAIEILVELGNHEKAAQLFEKQKQWEKAAEQYDLAGMQNKATECKAQIKNGAFNKKKKFRKFEEVNQPIENKSVQESNTNQEHEEQIQKMLELDPTLYRDGDRLFVKSFDKTPDKWFAEAERSCLNIGKFKGFCKEKVRKQYEYIKNSASLYHTSGEFIVNKSVERNNIPEEHKEAYINAVTYDFKYNKSLNPLTKGEEIDEKEAEYNFCNYIMQINYLMRLALLSENQRLFNLYNQMIDATLMATPQYLVYQVLEWLLSINGYLIGSYYYGLFDDFERDLSSNIISKSKNHHLIHVSDPEGSLQLANRLANCMELKFIPHQYHIDQNEQWDKQHEDLYEEVPQNTNYSHHKSIFLPKSDSAIKKEKPNSYMVASQDVDTIMNLTLTVDTQPSLLALSNKLLEAIFEFSAEHHPGFDPHIIHSKLLQGICWFRDRNCCNLATEYLARSLRQNHPDYITELDFKG